MSSVKLEGTIELIARLERASPAMQKRIKAAIQRGAQKIVMLARARAPRRTGELASSIRDEYSKDGMVGWVKAGYGILPRSASSGAQSSKGRNRALERQSRMTAALAKAKSSKGAMRSTDLGIYAPVVEYGDKRHNKPREPFLIPSFVATRPSIKNEILNGVDSAFQEVGLK